MDKAYVAQVFSEYSESWISMTTKSGNALHKTYGQAKAKAKRGKGGRVITYSLVEENVEYFGEHHNGTSN